MEKFRELSVPQVTRGDSESVVSPFVDIAKCRSRIQMPRRACCDDDASFALQGNVSQSLRIETAAPVQVRPDGHSSKFLWPMDRDRRQTDPAHFVVGSKGADASSPSTRSVGSSSARRSPGGTSFGNCSTRSSPGAWSEQSPPPTPLPSHPEVDELACFIHEDGGSLFGENVYVHVYDLNDTLAQVNAVALDLFGLGGVLHVGVEVFNDEYSYGTQGISVSVPRHHRYYSYRQSVLLGRTKLRRAALESAIDQLRKEWLGAEYDILSKNCGNFCNELCLRLGVGNLPAWVTRLAEALGSMPAARRVADAIKQQAVRGESGSFSLDSISPSRSRDTDVIPKDSPTAGDEVAASADGRLPGGILQNSNRGNTNTPTGGGAPKQGWQQRSAPPLVARQEQPRVHMLQPGPSKAQSAHKIATSAGCCLPQECQPHSIGSSHPGNRCLSTQRCDPFRIDSRTQIEASRRELAYAHPQGLLVASAGGA
eukprot:TRINITY_DN17588_c0_g1_i1.p1 TRINITY_DN17588_c0_g1~~TRINITY_DN17588_c0_g1_i1.p1  ORF type:complete len:482 (-),score=68.97 TRINITY_DN17588_c0_g1_i1:361-1806(-)